MVKAFSYPATLLVLATAISPAGAADAAKALRTLVYDVTYATAQTRDEKTSGFDRSGEFKGRAQIDSGDPNARQRLDSDDTGRLTLDVVAATGDGGLVVDASYVGRQVTQPPIRVAVYADGRLSWNMESDLSPEAQRMLPLLARGLVAGRPVESGQSWSVPTPGAASGSTTLHVKSVDGAVASLSLIGTATVSGARSGETEFNENVRYDVDHLMPLAADLHFRNRRQLSMDVSQSSNVDLTAKLASDSLTAR